MKRPGESINGAGVICWSSLDDRHITIGSCHQTIDGKTMSPYTGIAIGQRPGDPMAYPFYCEAQRHPVTDTYHLNIDRAKEEAELEFNGVGKTWNELGWGFGAACTGDLSAGSRRRVTISSGRSNNYRTIDRTAVA